MDTHETSIYYAILTGCVTVGVIMGYFVIALFRQQGRKVREQRLFFSREIESIEAERTRISRDLHDGAAPLIGLSKAYVNEICVSKETDRQHVEKVNKAMDQLAKQIKEVAVNLSPSSIARKGLRYSLEDFFFDVRIAYTMDVDFVYEVETKIDTVAATHLYRIVQEITQNAVKHSGGRRLRIHLREKKNKLYLLCKDDGRGFDAEDAKQSGNHHGLGNMKSRTEILQGKFRCTSKINYGTEYFFEFPLEGRNGCH